MKNKLITLLMVASLNAVAATPAIDFYGNTLPGALMLEKDSSGTPVAVSTSGITLPLYAYGASPHPKVNAFKAIKRECSKILPNHVSCYNTNPYETTITEDSICGYEAVPAAIVACTANTCVTEIYVQSCDSAHPKVGGSTSYSVSKSISSTLFAGALGDTTEIGQQGFHSSMDFTGNLNTAMLIKQQGREPILGLGSMLFDADGFAKPNAAQILDNAIARFPSLFTPGLLIELIDEPFMGSSGAKLQRQINDVNMLAVLLKSRVPNASVGIVVAPTWNQESHIIPSMEAVIANMNWLSTDTYQLTLGDNTAVNLANEFSAYMNQYHPNMPIFLIVQGFAPVYSTKPSDWTATEINQYIAFMNSMVTAAAAYDGVLIWGWTKVYELDDAFAGKNFPQVIKNLYEQFTR
jgi:hypothetical protein